MYKLCRSYQLWQFSLFIIAFSIVLPLNASAVQIGADMFTRVEAFDRNLALSVAQDTETSGAASSILPLGPFGDFLGNPSTASGLST